MGSFYGQSWGHTAGMYPWFYVGLPTSALYVPTYQRYYYFGERHYNEQAVRNSNETISKTAFVKLLET